MIDSQEAPHGRQLDTWLYALGTSIFGKNLTLLTGESRSKQLLSLIHQTTQVPDSRNRVLTKINKLQLATHFVNMFEDDFFPISQQSYIGNANMKKKL